ncbi:MAG: hypothetical protein HY881_11910 [Deltaproteobacteria bacterium]|nr:hypothetical protein [Deltaproteobacteria bacterium]
MTFHPGILALLLGSILTTSMLCYCAYEGARIIRNWDIRSGSELQLELERRTYLISMVMSYALGFELLSLFLFIYTADTLSSLFVGAMCAAGSLKVNGFGYPALILKIIDFLLAGTWLVVNFTDNKASDYPLIKTKYRLLIFITPFLIAETLVQGAYLLGLKPDIITSCCGTIFNADDNSVMSGLISLPRALSQTAFYFSLAITISLGLVFYLKGKGGYFFSISTLMSFLIAVVALISFISVYFYELPTHHCPFCILHPEYGYVGYPLYITLLAGAVSGLGVGAIMPFRKIDSLAEVLPPIQRRLALISILSHAAFILISGYGILFSHLSLAAY